MTRQSDIVGELAGLGVRPGALPGKLDSLPAKLEEPFEHSVIPNLCLPATVNDFPVRVSLLTREHS